MRVLLAGAGGVIGRRVIPMLIAANHQVSALTRQAGRASALRSLGADPLLVDVYHRDDLIRTVAAARPDVVMHQLTDLSETDLVANARLRETGTRHLVDATLAAGVPKMVAQSISWAYRPGDDPADEATPLHGDADEPRRTSVQGVIALESEVAEIQHHVVLRYGLLYGPDTWYGLGGSRAADARAERMVGDGDVTSFVHVEDAARAAVEAVDWPTGVANICDDEPATGHEWLPLYCRAVGAPVPPLRSGRAHRWARGASNTYARAVLGWTPHYASWRTGFVAAI